MARCTKDECRNFWFIHDDDDTWVDDYPLSEQDIAKYKNALRDLQDVFDKLNTMEKNNEYKEGE